MRKILLASAIFLILGLPFLVSAAQIKTGRENVNIPQEEIIEDDLYIFTANARVAGTIKGDVLIFGGQVQVVGKVEGDVLVLAGEVDIDGEVLDDVRVLSGSVTVAGKVSDDVVLASGTFDLTRNGVVAGDIKAFAGNITISGQASSVEVEVGNLLVSPSTKIENTLVYTSDKEALIESGANIKGGVTFNKIESKKDFWHKLGLTTGKISYALMLLILSLILFWLLPNASRKISDNFQSGFGKSLFWGFLFLVIVPIAAILAIITFLGIPLGVLSLVIYGVVLFLAQTSAVFGIAKILKKTITKNDNNMQIAWLDVVMGLIIFTLLGIIPVVGPILVLLAFLAGLGSLVNFNYEFVKDLKSKKVL